MQMILDLRPDLRCALPTAECVLCRSGKDLITSALSYDNKIVWYVVQVRGCLRGTAVSILLGHEIGRQYVIRLGRQASYQSPFEEFGTFADQNTANARFRDSFTEPNGIRCLLDPAADISRKVVQKAWLSAISLLVAMPAEVVWQSLGLAWRRYHDTTVCRIPTASSSQMRVPEMPRPCISVGAPSR